MAPNHSDGGNLNQGQLVSLLHWWPRACEKVHNQIAKAIWLHEQGKQRDDTFSWKFMF